MKPDTSTLTEVAKATPPVTVAGAHFVGIPLAEWITILTIIYLVAQIILLLPKYWEWYKNWRLKCRSKQDSPPQG